MNFTNFINFLLGFAHPFEKKVEKFLKNLKSNSYTDKVQKELLNLMQENLAILNVYLEWKSRGYKYLKRGSRKKMYEDLEILRNDFLSQIKDSTEFTPRITEELKAINCSYPVYKEKEINYLWQIMKYLEPGKRFLYQESTSFGHLLCNPNQAKLIGDCNQIVTLYAYFYSLKYPVTDLKIKLLPEHVCLHFEDLDIEATNGHFANYKENAEILEISELISTNLLDISDSREEQTSISPRIMLKTSQLAYKISSKKELVTKNLTIAYRNLGINEMRANNFESAIYYIGQSQDRDLLNKCYHNACIYSLNNKNFKKAHSYANMNGDIELKTSVALQEANHYYETNDTKNALKIYKNLGKHEMVKACLQKDYFNQYQKIKEVQTIIDAKKHKSVYQNLLRLSQEMQDSEREQWVRSILSKI